MSIVMQSKLANLLKLNKWRIWRIFNSLVIFLSFFAPWVVMDWGGQRDLSLAWIDTGFDQIQWYRRLGLTFLFDFKFPPQDRISIGMDLLIHYFFGLVAILLYCVLNMIVAGFRTKFIDKPVWKISTFCLIALGGMGLWYTAGLELDWWKDMLHNLLWGYWLVLIGLVSSLALEISYSISKKT